MSRFLSTGLAAVAVASSITLSAPAASAADPNCALPGVTVPHAAQTHAEWLWQRTEVVDGHTSHRFSRVQREYSYTDHEWTRQHITQQHVPGQPATGPTYEVLRRWQKPVEPTVETTGWLTRSPGAGWVQIEERTVTGEPGPTELVIDPDEPDPYAYVNKHGKVTYRATADWNGGGDTNHDEGWNRLPSDDKMIEVQQPGLTHQEYRYQLSTPHPPLEQWALHSPGAGWSDTGDQRNGEMLDPGSDEVPAVEEVGEQQFGWTPDSSVPPSGDGWALTGTTQVHSVWSYTAPDTATVPWAATGGTKPAEHLTTRNVLSAPEGEGWTLTGSDDVPATTRVVTSDATSGEAPDTVHSWSRIEGSKKTVEDRAAWTETVRAATPACDSTPGPARGPDSRMHTSGTPSRADQVGPQAAPAPAAGVLPSVLPSTGSDVPVGAAATGFGAVLLGAVLVLLGRRRRFDAN